MKRNLWLVVIGALMGSILIATAADTRLNGLFYAWPSSHAAKALVNNGSGTLSWTGDIDSGVPTGLIGFYVASSTCPTGWSEYTAARGRYIVTATSDIGTTVGTALDANAGENRPAGTHGHTASITASISDSTHGHSVDAANHTHNGLAAAGEDTNENDASFQGAWSETTTGTATTGISMGNTNAGISASPTLTVTGVSGGVAGTNAPYIRMLVCRKQ
jgi:hypothetical protein